MLDPLGLGLEELDGIGALRQSEAGAPIDTSGALSRTADSTTADRDHAMGTGTLLTSTELHNFTVLTNDISLDQAVVKALAPKTRFPARQSITRARPSVTCTSRC